MSITCHRRLSTLHHTKPTRPQFPPFSCGCVPGVGGAGGRLWIQDKALILGTCRNVSFVGFFKHFKKC